MEIPTWINSAQVHHSLLTLCQTLSWPYAVLISFQKKSLLNWDNQHVFPVLHLINLWYYDQKMKTRSRDAEPSWFIGQVRGRSITSLELKSRSDAKFDSFWSWIPSAPVSWRAAKVNCPCTASAQLTQAELWLDFSQVQLYCIFWSLPLLRASTAASVQHCAWCNKFC